jgi:DNA-binding transcriptional ArsR family regulator
MHRLPFDRAGCHPLPLAGRTDALRTLQAICRKPRTVNEIVTAVGATQAHVSKHLLLLAGAGILVRQKEGQQVLRHERSAGPVALHFGPQYTLARNARFFRLISEITQTRRGGSARVAHLYRFLAYSCVMHVYF